MHIALKDDLPAQNRRKRSLRDGEFEDDRDAPRTCATGRKLKYLFCIVYYLVNYYRDLWYYYRLRTLFN